ncbi:MAG: hypothetical protein IPP71_00555 [Bacteroidetes bacterium]|nr:hypothetical protein [Bacteroidota bacterium]
MTLILLNWFFIFITCLGTGAFFLKVIRKFLNIEEKSESIVYVLITGIFFIAAFCNILSFFLPIDAFVRYTVLLFSFFILYSNRVWLIELFRFELFRLREMHFIAKSSLLAIFLIAIIKSAGPSELIDEGGYYLPYIRWIEDFKLTPGIANIEDRMGFNSSFHMLSAFFSMREFYNDGLYDLNGFLLFICSVYFVSGPNRLIKGLGNLSIVDFVKTFCLFFLLRNMLTSSPSDLINVFFAEMALVLFIEKAEKGNYSKVDDKFVMIFLITLFLITIKFSSVGLFFLPLFLLFVSGNQFKKCFMMFLGVGFVVMSVWLVRSYFISGYLVYPVYFVDFFDPVWKIPEAYTKTQYFYVQEFARLNAERDVSEQIASKYSTSQWIPLWFNLLNLYDKIMTIALLAMVLVSFYLIVFRKFFRSRYFVLYLILLLNLGMWFFSYPAFRFGWAFIMVFIALISSIFITGSRFISVFRFSVIIIFLLFTAQSFYKTIKGYQNYLVTTIVFPAEVPHPETNQITLKSGLKVEVAAGEECWGISPPCFPVNHRKRIEMIGNKITDGFYVEK